MIYETVEKNSKEIVFVYTTCPSISEAREIGLSVIKEKLAASADYWLINSIYPWDKVIQEGEQYMLMFVTEKSLSSTLMKHIEMEHSYSIPVIMRSETLVTNQSYHFWVDNILTDKEGYITETEEEIKKRSEKGANYERLK
jgi:uncharacterized protein involved in tolerance to divalent cations